MSVRKTVGGDRLGSGGKLTTSLKGYERSTHDLGRVTRTTMTQGTIVPIFVEFAQKGDTWDIDLESLIRTHPTNGPIFGSYKFQVDVFTADIRLYNKQLHNNQTGLGMNMKNVIFPQMVLNGKNPEYGYGELSSQQVSPDSLLAYLGVRGLGTRIEGLGNDKGRVAISRNGMPLMAYWDIYKEYYSNKQEEIGYVIQPDFELQRSAVVTEIRVAGKQYPVEWEYLEASGEKGSKAIYLAPGDSMILRGSGLKAKELQAYLLDWPLTQPSTARYGNPELNKDGQFTWENVTYSQDGTEAVFTNLQGSTFMTLIGDIWTGVGQDYETRHTNTNPNIIWSVGGEVIQEGIGIEEFELSNIDDMRERVFSQAKTAPLRIGASTTEPLPYRATVGQDNVNNQVTENSNLVAYYPMAGLGIKTYQSDRFNNWLSTEWIEQINNISSVDVTGGSFTMDALNLAKKVYELENRVAVSGGTYQDWLEAVYGEKAYGAPEMPVYRGGMSAEITFDEVVSNSDGTTAEGYDQPLGTLAGKGVQRNKKGGRIRIRIEEHGYVMILASITPRIDYTQGNKWHMKLETMDDIHKPQLDSIGFQELLTDEFAAWDTKVSADGTEQFHSIGKQPSWTQYCTNQNEAYGNFARENSELWMILSRRYESNPDGTLKDATTYIDPTKFNYPFAYTELENQPFWVQVAINSTVRRKMSANQMPNL